MKRRDLARAIVHWLPLVGGLAATTVIAHAGLKPVGVALLLAPPAVAAAVLVIRPRAGWLVRLVLAGQVLVGILVLTFGAGVKLAPPVTPDGHVVMATGQLALALLCGAVLTPLWAMSTSIRNLAPGRPELVWLVATFLVTAASALL